MAESNNFDLNFFKPSTKHARANRKLILFLATIWLVSVFGFQVLLMVLNKPTPEKAYASFEAIWPSVVERSEGNMEAKKEFARILLSVLGKNIAVTDAHKAQLKEAFSWNLYSMLPESDASILMQEPGNRSIELAVETIGLADSGFDKILTSLLSSSIIKVNNPEFPDESKKEIPGIMELYLVHNQNVFTNFTFLGFPFHYWYTAQFLLILFVALCFIYAKVIDKANKKHDFVEEN